MINILPKETAYLCVFYVLQRYKVFSILHLIIYQICQPNSLLPKTTYQVVFSDAQLTSGRLDKILVDKLTS